MKEMKHNDLALEKAAADNFHPDQVWARKLQHKLATQGLDGFVIESTNVPKEFAEMAVQFSQSETVMRVTQLFACVSLARHNDNSDPEFPKNPEVEIKNFKSATDDDNDNY